jgi:hypothetical protein
LTVTVFTAMSQRSNLVDDKALRPRSPARAPRIDRDRHLPPLTYVVVPTTVRYGTQQDDYGGI